MKIVLSGVFLLVTAMTFSFVTYAQLRCPNAAYTENLRKQSAAVARKLMEAEQFITFQKSNPLTSVQAKDGQLPKIHIPVVVHVIYHSSNENISDEQIQSQIKALNRDYRRQNDDSVKTPARFKNLAADINIDFGLATADPSGRATTGVVRKHSGVTSWGMDDGVKFSESGGDDAWDSRYYLNIWVCNLQGALGYSSMPGSPANKDGVVISVSSFGTINVAAPYNLGRTGVHEVGHWLGLKHVWGDSFCGDDLVDDTPKQGSFTSGCPGEAFLSSCDNGPLGDMYMNYMDFTDDACMNLFTVGQKQRMLANFSEGGPRNTILSSKGLAAPWVFTAAPKTEEPSAAVTPLNLYPNPAVSELNLVTDASYIGQEASLLNLNGTLINRFKIVASTQKVYIDRLTAGMYFLEIGGKARRRFIKL